MFLFIYILLIAIFSQYILKLLLFAAQSRLQAKTKSKGVCYIQFFANQKGTETKFSFGERLQVLCAHSVSSILLRNALQNTFTLCPIICMSNNRNSFES